MQIGSGPACPLHVPLTTLAAVPVRAVHGGSAAYFYLLVDALFDISPFVWACRIVRLEYFWYVWYDAISLPVTVGELFHLQYSSLGI